MTGTMTEPVVNSITPAELKTTLGGLGLPPSWFATHMGVTMRTVVRWFDGEIVTPKVAAELQRLCDVTAEEMTRMTDAAGERYDVVLHTYRTDDEYAVQEVRGMPPLPATWHRQLTFRVMENMRAQGRNVTVEYR